MPDDLIREAVRLLRAGQLVSFPTETVYGLGADAGNKEAIKRLYLAKGRPSSHPVIVHLHALSEVESWTREIPPAFYKLADAFWPGPLTVVLKRAPHVLDEVTGGQETVACRMPNHPLALALLKEFGGGLVAPSANKFGRLSPTEAQHVRDEFSLAELPLVLDGGPCEVGIESTIVDLSRANARILRPGMINALDIEAVIGPLDGSPAASSTSSRSSSAKAVTKPDDPRVPGSLLSHYAPTTPLFLVPGHSFPSFIQEHLARGKSVSVISFQSPPPEFRPDLWIILPRDPYLFARQIYSCLRNLDQRHSEMIVVESPPHSDLVWTGIQDRLTRAAHR